MSDNRPEKVMVRRGLAAGLVALPLAAAAGYLVAGANAAWSAAIGVTVVALNFAAHGLSLAWAAGISITAVQVTALAGFVVRMGVIVGLMFALSVTGSFSPLAFGIAVVAGTLALLAYEARLVLVAGIGRDLDLPPDPAAVRAADRLRAREGGT
jgi:hypothetical protein